MVAIRQIIKVLPGSLPRENECATMPSEININITLSQSSIIITCFNHVTYKYSSKKVKGVLAV